MFDIGCMTLNIILNKNQGTDRYFSALFSSVSLHKVYSVHIYLFIYLFIYFA